MTDSKITDGTSIRLKDNLLIAVDGPAASGKGTLARRLARHYGLGYLDTGSLYRATALSILKDKGDFTDLHYAAAKAQELTKDDVLDPALRQAGVGEGASIIAKIPQVREALLDYQRNFAKTPPGAVLDGRDIGTIILPNATVKLFITATLDVRAKRRFLELKGGGGNLTLEDVRQDIQIRDKRDQGRDIAPLQKAEDAYLLDTTNLDINAAMEAAVQLIDRAIESKINKE